MRDATKPPPVPPRYRVPLRIAAVFAGYLFYRLVGDDRLMAGIALWAGTVAIGFALVDRYTLRAVERLQLTNTGLALLGLGLVGLGVYLALR